MKKGGFGEENCMRYGMIFLFFFLLLSPALGEPVVFRNDDLGFQLTYSDKLLRKSESESQSVPLVLQEGTATLIVGAGFDQPGLDQQEYSTEVLGDYPDIREVTLDGLTFYRLDKVEETPGGKPIVSTAFFFYDPEGGAFIHFLITVERDASEEVRQALLDVVYGFEVTGVASES